MAWVCVLAAWWSVSRDLGGGGAGGGLVDDGLAAGAGGGECLDGEVVVAPGRLPIVGHALALQRRPLEFLESLNSYGDVVKIYLGHLPVYVVTSPELVHQMLVTEAGSFDKGRLFDKMRGFVGNGILTSGGELHRRQRRLLQPAFHRERITHYVKVMRETTETLAATWRPGQVVEMQGAIDELSLGVAAAALFSSELGRHAVDEVQRCLPIVLRGVVARTLSPVEVLHKLPTPGNRRFIAAEARVRRVIDGVIEAYRADGTDCGDLLSMVLAARDADTGQGMTDVQARDELVTLLLAAAETTASTLGSFFHELGRHPSIEHRVSTELREVLDGRAIDYGDIARLEYTQRVLTEVLRLYMPTDMLMRRTATDVTLGDTRLPAGTELLFSIPVLHRDPVFYPDPLTFDPDRWLRQPVKDLPRGAYIPFGGGNRQCIGNTFALTEMMVVAATILSRWELTPVPGSKPRRIHRGVSRLSRLPMIARPRGGI